MTHSERLKLIREQKGFSQYRLAKLSGVSQAYISKYERGANSVGLSALEKVCPALGISVADFLSETDSPSNAIEESAETTGLEKTLLDIFRALPPDKQKQLIDIAKVIDAR